MEYAQQVVDGSTHPIVDRANIQNGTAVLMTVNALLQFPCDPHCVTATSGRL